VLDDFEDARRGLLAALRDPESAQRGLLAEILRTHQHTEIGRELGFESIRDLESYRARVPVVTYADIEASVARMLGGEADVLLAGQPVFFAQSTGTTGPPKRVGFHPRVAEGYRNYFGPMVATLELAFPGATARSIYILAQYREAESKLGIPIGQASGYLHHLFRPRGMFQRIPEQVYESKDYEARYHAILWLALAEPVVCLTALYPSVLLNLFDRARDFARELAEDLRRGALAAGPGDLAALAPALGDRLRPRPEQAQRLLDVVRVHGEFVPEEFWPELRVLQVWKGGSARHYLAELARRCPRTVLFPAPSGSTEANLLVGLEAGWHGGVPALRSTVFEFLPEGSAPAPDAFVPLQELEEQRSYRLVVTTDRGLYRYLMDDVFTVEARHLGAPVLAFSHRLETASVAGEKMSEAHVMRAVAAAGARGELAIARYEVAPEVGERPRYSIALELGRPASDEALHTFLVAFERELCAANISYEQYRQAGLLRDPVLYEMGPRYFETARAARAATARRSDAQMKATILHTGFMAWAGDALRRVGG
jgi:hypothetical protein